VKRTELFICAPLLIFSVILSCKTEPQHHDIPIAVWHGRQAVPVTRTELQYAHQAGFTICILEQDNQRFNENALALADSLGLQLILSDEKLKRFTLGLDSTFYAVDSITKSYKRHRSFMGPLLFDKPGLDDFPGIIDLIDYFAVKHSDLTPFIQALPGYASPARLDTSNYNDYLSLFVQKLKPRIIGVEHFGILKDGLRSEFFTNLDALRRQALKSGIPFWAFALVVPFNEYPEMVHSRIRCQLYSGLAYGARGVQYFSLLPPKQNSYTYGDAILDDFGERTQTFWDARTINAEIKKLGKTLLQLTSTAVAFSKPVPPGGNGFSPGLPIVKISAPTMLAGFFRDKHKNNYVLLVNTDMNYGKLATITFDHDVKSIIEIPKGTMPPEEYVWPKNEMEKQAALLFRAGDGRLFKIHKQD